MNHIQEGKSFHIEQNFDGSWVIMWPPASLGIYCDDKATASLELENLKRKEAESQFRLVSLDAVRSTENGKILGVVYGTHKVE